MTGAARILFGVCLGVCISANGRPIAAQTVEPKEDVKAREEYFWSQRSYPSTERPYAQMERARMAVSAQRSALSAFSFSAGVPGGWRSLGPNGLFMADNGFFSSGPMLDIGRVTAIAPSTAGTLFIGTASGGVWQSITGGYWSALTDAQCNLSVGALTIDAADPNVLFAGTGEYNTDSWGELDSAWSNKFSSNSRGKSSRLRVLRKAARDSATGRLSRQHGGDRRHERRCLSFG
jgi:hypothetical protein